MAQSSSNTHPQVENFLGRPVAKTIESSGETYIFDRLATAVDDEFPLEQLNQGELLIRPGLIYRAIN